MVSLTLHTITLINILIKQWRNLNFRIFSSDEFYNGHIKKPYNKRQKHHNSLGELATNHISKSIIRSALNFRNFANDMHRIGSQSEYFTVTLRYRWPRRLVTMIITIQWHLSTISICVKIIVEKDPKSHERETIIYAGSCRWFWGFQKEKNQFGNDRWWSSSNRKTRLIMAVFLHFGH